MNSGSDKVNKRRRKNINCHITDSSLENNKYKHEFIQKFRYRELILRNYRVSDYNNCCEDVKLIIRIKTPYKYNSISGGINRRIEHRSSILNAISATMNKEVYVNKQPVREKKTRRIYQYAGESDLEISLRMGGYDFKPRQEAVRVGCHDTISTGTAAHPEQNMYSPFCCRIFREAFNNSSMPTTAGFTGNPYPRHFTIFLSTTRQNL